jgi:hypothetical protein
VPAERTKVMPSWVRVGSMTIASLALSLSP